MNLQAFNQVLANYLQYNIKINKINNDELILLREGKLININFKIPYITFKIEYKEKQREFHYPIPFRWESENDAVLFDYTLNNLSKDNPVLLDKLSNLPYDSDNPFYNGQLKIIFDG